MKKILAAILCALFAVLPFAACTEGGDGKTIRLNEVTHSIFYAPLYAAEALGYFEEEGITIELTNGGGADNVMAAVLSGSADIGFCGPEAALYVLIGGSDDGPTGFGPGNRHIRLSGRQKRLCTDFRSADQARRLVPRFARGRKRHL